MIKKDPMIEHYEEQRKKLWREYDEHRSRQSRMTINSNANATSIFIVVIIVSLLSIFR